MMLAAMIAAANASITVLALRSGAHPTEITFFGFVFASLIYLAFLGVVDRGSLTIKGRLLAPLLVFSFITGTLANLTWYMAIERTSVAIAVGLYYTYPSLVTIGAIYLLGEKLNLQKGLALPMTFIGAFLVAGGAGLNNRLSFDIFGVILALFTAVAGAVWYLWGKRLLMKNSANTVVLYTFLLSIPTAALIANPIRIAQTSLSSVAWILILMMGVQSVVIYILSMVALKHIEASKASIITSIEPAVAVMIAYFVAAQTITGIQSVGIVLVFLGLMVLGLLEKPDSRSRFVPPEKRP